MSFRMVNGSTHSENGWRLCDRNECELVPGPFMNTAPLRNGPPAIILGEFVRRYHAKVAPVISPVWGWSRDNDVLGGWGKNNGSNHLAGTAVDINAPQWPWGYKRMPQWLIDRIYNLMSEFEIDGQSGIFWGREWNKPDEMHFQMRWKEGDSRNDRLVMKLLGQGQIGPINRKEMKPGEGGTLWADVSQWQIVPIDETYQHKVFSFRTNSGNSRDVMGVENARQVKQLLDDGRLEIAIPYYFFRPGQANCDLHREILEEAELFNHPRTVSMVDVEGDNGSVKGDNSWEINDEVGRLGRWYENPRKVIGYYNSNANPALWPNRAGVNLVVPQYYRTPGDISSIKDSGVRAAAIAHQYTDKDTNQSPWNGKPVDMNWSPYSVEELLVLFGMEEGTDWMSDPTIEKMIREIHACLFNQIGSQSRYRLDDEGKRWQLHELIKNDDGLIHESYVERLAILGDPDNIVWVVRNALRNDPQAQSVLMRIEDRFLTDEQRQVKNDVIISRFEMPQ